MLSWSSYSRGRTPFPRRTCSEIRGFPSITVLVLTKRMALCRCSVLYQGPASMGPRSHERGNVAAVLAEVNSKKPLQWGRVLTNAETTNEAILCVEQFTASMGPRSHERGNPSRLLRPAGRPACFNGAAFSRTRKLRRQRARRHRAPSFNGAAFSRTRKQRQL